MVLHLRRTESEYNRRTHGGSNISKMAKFPWSPFNRSDLDYWLGEDPYFQLRDWPDTEDEVCSCEDEPPIKLMAALSSNPVHCMNCNLWVEPETLGLSSEVTQALANWAAIARAIEYLDLDSQEYEAFAITEEENIESPLNRRGRDVVTLLQHTRPCYLWWHPCEETRVNVPNPTCPICDRPMISYTKCFFPVWVCQLDWIATTN